MTNEYEPGGAIYHQAVAHRGGHEYAGGPVVWDHADGEHPPCLGCPLCSPDAVRKQPIVHVPTA